MFTYLCEVVSIQPLPAMDQRMQMRLGVECSAVLVWAVTKLWKTPGDENWQKVCELDDGRLYDDSLVKFIAGSVDGSLYLQNAKLKINESSFVIQTPEVDLFAKEYLTGSPKRATIADYHNRIQHSFAEPFTVLTVTPKPTPSNSISTRLAVVGNRSRLVRRRSSALAQ